MGITEEMRPVIKETAYEVAEIVCKRHEEKYRQMLEQLAERQYLAMRLHEADCPGRRVGKGAAVAIMGAVSAAGALIMWLIRGGSWGVK